MVSERRGWKVEILSLSEGTLSGLKEAIFAARGAKAYGTLRYESGVHRVQRGAVTDEYIALMRSTWTTDPVSFEGRYYRVEDAEGRRFWVFRAGLYGRETQEPRWFLHGLFP